MDTISIAKWFRKTKMSLKETNTIRPDGKVRSVSVTQEADDVHPWK